jgi:hypothetical protein
VRAKAMACRSISVAKDSDRGLDAVGTGDFLQQDGKRIDFLSGRAPGNPYPDRIVGFACREKCNRHEPSTWASRD